MNGGRDAQSDDAVDRAESQLHRNRAFGQLGPWLVGHEGEIPYSVRRSRRARRVSLSITPAEGLVITVPERLALRHVPAIVEERRQWIRDAFDRLSEVRERYEQRASEPALPTVIELRALGERRWVLYAPDANGRPRVTEQGPYRVVVSGCHTVESAQLSLRRWLADRTRADVVPWLHDLAVARNLTVTGTSVRNQKTRWASCSSSGAMSLNLNLLFLPRRLVRFVLIHELCHRIEMSHSPRFWRLLENEEPDMAALSDELDDAWALVPRWSQD